MADHPITKAAKSSRHELPVLGPFVSDRYEKRAVWSARLCRLIGQHNTPVGRDLAGTTGLEPATSGVTGRESV
jgi:hypothetical protein